MTDFVAVFPILRPLTTQDGLEDEAFRVVSELTALGDSIQLPALDPQAYQATIEVLSHSDQRFPAPKRDRRLAYLGTRSKQGFRSWVVAKLSVAIDIDPGLWTPGLNKDEPDPLESDPVVVSRQICVETLAREIFDLCCTANIASPGAFDIGAAFIYENGQLVDTRTEVMSDLYIARRYATRTSWPTLRPLSLTQTWSWVHRLKLPERLGDAPVSRAYNAWTYQFGPLQHRNALDLFWALMGVEALYNDGREGVREQLLRRCQLLLGERKTHKQDLSEMYRLRSALVHGGLPFPARDFPYDALPRYESFHADMENATAIAQALLAGSLQELACRNLAELRFETVLRGIPIVE